MAVDLHKLVAAIVPNLYCEKEVRDEVKKVVKQALERGDKDAYLQGAKIAKPVKSEPINYVKTFYGNTLNPKSTFKNPVEKHKLIYDNFGEGLEPIYFWILDTLQNTGYKEVDKLVDNFISSPGSGHFSEIGAKATRMQEESMKMLGAVNQVVKSILNIIYDLKEFQIRLRTYEDANSKDQSTRIAASYALKQIWMDSVDAKRGTTSLKGLVQNFDYVTIIDAFMAAESLEDLKKLDLNERVGRILEQRLADFLRWVKESEKELKKRFEIEKNYLKSQYNTVQLYTRWVKPYLEAAKNLEQHAKSTEALVSAFNTTLFELTLLARRGYDPDDDIKKGDLPESFKDKNKREYYPTTVIEFKFRSSPEKFGQNYGFRGKTQIEFTGYSLNKDEVKVLKQQLEYDTFGDVLELITGATKDSLGEIKEDIDYFLYDKKPKEDEEEEEEREEREEDANPFTALFGGKKKEKKDSKEKPGIESDNEYEKILRGITILEARRWCVKLYDIYKKGHGMVAFGTLEDAF